MRVSFGPKYSGLAHGMGCACHSPLALHLFQTVNKALSRRSVLSGIAATLGASALGLASPSFAQATAKPVLLKNARIFDGVAGKLAEGKSVLIDGKTIKSLPGTSETVADADVIDCAGRTLMPGMIDAHWHALLAGISQVAAMTADIPYVHLVAAQEAERTIMRGFTTVRDVGGPSFALKRAIDEGRMPGPRIYPSGAMISQTSGHGDFRMRGELPRTPQSDLSAAEQAGVAAIADGEAEVLRRVREELMLGASQIKIMGGGGVASAYDPIDALQYTEAEMKAAVAAATDWGTYVAIHAYTSAAVQRAIASGVKSIEHGQLIDEETAKRIADAGAWWSIQPFLADEDANTYSSPDQRAQQQMIAEGTARAVELGKKHSVKMALGTDILFNPKGTATQGKQLAKFSRWYENVDVLRLLTSGNADLAGLSGPRNPYPGKLGRIEAGAYADILVVDGNPLDDISLIADPDRTLKLIMKDGRIHKNTLAG
ncbi:amidohydrolase family protein [Mesorhizobium sp. VK25A]|uniref:Amidohydrolase family protein n=1 Tax=Mesorhizobium vachelliae TaxID=3072309 RepID=A0ABU4ZZQ7_9HYPH|nr:MULTISPECIES: amidohydrolase family protein [unclassified Mesorhizobium]MDX8529779.1 amidohydrolase family protein [Mesorhizobium sp. VK25D]MDX8544177.1 amidohydrolase family protein [Mesorhizobium sp. VK25A]